VVPVEQLKVGMFVSALDRPWLDTPFLVQGFLIEDEATIAQLRQMCRQVVIDISRSNVDELSGLALPSRARQQPKDREEVVRVVTAPPVALAPPRQSRGWLARVLHGLSEARQLPAASPKERPTPPPTRSAPSSPARVASRPTRPGAASLRPPGPGEGAVVTSAPAQGSALSGSLLDWLKDGLDRLRANEAGIPAPSDLLEEPVRSQPLPGRRVTEVRIYQDTVPVEQELSRANQSFARAAETVHDVIRDIREGKGLQLDAVQDVVEDLVESIVRHPGALQLVSRLREANESAYTHALQVAVLLVSFGRELGFSREELTQLGQVGMMLDVGKLKVDQNILEKRGNLTAAEFEQVKRHVQHGLDIIHMSGLAHADVIAGVAQHHERLNGTGYPGGLKEGEIGAFGQMAGIVDVFCALTSVRPYSEPSSAYDAMRQLQGWSGTYFNTGLVEQFIQAIGIFPVGTLVELSTGEIAVVLEQNRARRLKPKVLVVSDPDKSPLKIPLTLDLLYGGGAASEQRPYIRRGLPTESSAIDAKEYYLSRG
jgi:HD-GYP domain-containing protein (c-di-GMP phosphodiesterase class II)